VQVLSFRFQRIFTKLSFAVYLTQFPIFFYNVGKIRSAEHFEFSKVMFNLEEFIAIILASVALHVLVEAPFNNLRKLMFDKSASIRVKKVE